MLITTDQLLRAKRVLSLPLYFGLVNGTALVGVARPRLEPFDEVHPERSRRAQEKLRRRVCDGQEGGAVGAGPKLKSLRGIFSRRKGNIFYPFPYNY